MRDKIFCTADGMILGDHSDNPDQLSQSTAKVRIIVVVVVGIIQLLTTPPPPSPSPLEQIKKITFIYPRQCL